MKTLTKIIFASAITLSAAAPAAFAQNMGWGNASTPGASVQKDDQSAITIKSKNTREHASRPESQTTGYGNASAPGASVKKDDTTAGR
jgi:hypothetical protein